MAPAFTFLQYLFPWFSLAEFSWGRMQRTMRNVAFVATLYLFMGLYTYPGGIMPEVCDDIFNTYFTAHSFFYHHLVILYMMLTIAFKRFHPLKRDSFTWMACFAFYFTTAVICAYTFEENYFDILNSEPLPVIEPIRLAVGQFWYDAGLAFVVVFLGAGVMCLTAIISSEWRRIKEARKK